MLLDNNYIVSKYTFSEEELEVLRRDLQSVLDVKCYERSQLAQEFVAENGCIVEPMKKCEISFENKVTVEEYCSRRYEDYSTCPLQMILSNKRFASVLQRVTNRTTLYLFNEQYIVKPPKDDSSAFPWHRDDDMLRNFFTEEKMPEFLSIWIPLDDVSVKKGNGCLIFEGERKAVDVSQGDSVFISSTISHKSLPNHSGEFRRAYMIQFSLEPILNAGNQPVAYAIPVRLNC